MMLFALLSLVLGVLFGVVGLVLPSVQAAAQTLFGTSLFTGLVLFTIAVLRHQRRSIGRSGTT